MSDAERVVREYFRVVADLRSTTADLDALLHEDVVVVEHPNRFAPGGSVRDRAAVVAGFLAGKQLLGAQAIEIHEALVSGQRVAVRATWRGTVATGSPALAAGTELVTHMAAFLTVEDGRIRSHETYDCVVAGDAGG